MDEIARGLNAAAEQRAVMTGNRWWILEAGESSAMTNLQTPSRRNEYPMPNL
jgi:hypothetical protein